METKNRRRPKKRGGSREGSRERKREEEKDRRKTNERRKYAPIRAREMEREGWRGGGEGDTKKKEASRYRYRNIAGTDLDRRKTHARWIDQQPTVRPPPTVHFFHRPIISITPELVNLTRFHALPNPPPHQVRREIALTWTSRVRSSYGNRVSSRTLWFSRPWKRLARTWSAERRRGRRVVGFEEGKKGSPGRAHTRTHTRTHAHTVGTCRQGPIVEKGRGSPSKTATSWGGREMGEGD